MALKALSGIAFKEIVRCSGFSSPRSGCLSVPFLDRCYHIAGPDYLFKDSNDEQKSVPLQEQVLILHYLNACFDQDIRGEWIAYREIPGAGFYTSAFIKRAIDPLKKVFGVDPLFLRVPANRLGGKPISAGDVGFQFELLPQAPMQIIIWAQDEEFAAEASILFDKTIGEIFSPEDVAWYAGMLVYRLIGLVQKKE